MVGRGLPPAGSAVPPGHALGTHLLLGRVARHVPALASCRIAIANGVRAGGSERSTRRRGNRRIARSVVASAPSALLALGNTDPLSTPESRSPSGKRTLARRFVGRTARHAYSLLASDAPGRGKPRTRCCGAHDLVGTGHTGSPAVVRGCGTADLLTRTAD